MSGKRAIVTGGSSGVGVATARALAAAGADVTLAVRNLEAGKRTAVDIAASTGNDRIGVSQLDLADRASVARFVGDWTGPLHILVNNAGGILPTLERTAEGFEKQFAANHIGHFVLAVGLHDALAAAGEARIVSVTSAGHLYSPVVFDDLHFDYRPYDSLLAYGQSKTANALFAVGATSGWAKDGITANAAMPGAVATNFIRNVDPAMLERRRRNSRWTDRRRSSRRRSKAPRPPYSWPFRHCFAASAVAISRTGMRHFSSRTAMATAAALPRTPWTRRTPTASGKCHSGLWNDGASGLRRAA